jgi:hypothetical protein
MNILIFIAVVIVVLALVWCLITLLPFIQPPFKLILQIIAVLAAIIVICRKAGWI